MAPPPTPVQPLTRDLDDWLRRFAWWGLAMAFVALVLRALVPIEVEQHVVVDTIYVAHMVPGAAAFSVFVDVAIYPIAGATVVAALLRARLWRGWTPRVAWAAAGSVGFVVAWASAQVLKVVFSRPRPELMWAGTSVSAFSFPSGHSAMAGALVVVAALCFPRRVAVAYAVFALSVGASRMVLGVHWPTDVLGGLGWGVGAAALVAWGILRITPALLVRPGDSALR